MGTGRHVGIRFLRGLHSRFFDSLYELLFVKDAALISEYLLDDLLCLQTIVVYSDVAIECESALHLVFSDLFSDSLSLVLVLGQLARVLVPLLKCMSHNPFEVLQVVALRFLLCFWSIEID